MAQEVMSQIDPALREFVFAPNEARARQEIEKLAAGLTPYIRRTILFHLRKTGALSGTSMGVEDVVSEVWMRILPRLMALRTCPEIHTLYNIRAFTFKVVRNYCSDCAMQTEREKKYVIAQEADDKERILQTVIDKSCQIERSAEMRAAIEKLWSEILLLNRQQRTVMMLDILREKECLLLIAHGVTSLTSIAEATELPDTVIAYFYRESPCDCEIARLLNCPEQRVANLRSSARKRLNRRMGEWL